MKICQYVSPLPNPKFPFPPTQPPTQPLTRKHKSKPAPRISPLRCSGPAGRVGFRRGGGQAPERRLREPCPVQTKRQAGPQQSQKRLQIRTREPPFFTPARFITLCFDNLKNFWKVSESSLTSGNFLEFPAILAKFCDNLSEKQPISQQHFSEDLQI